MNKIKFIGDWGSGCDMLDDKPLKDGECLEVAWPNGIWEQMNITVRQERGTVSDHGKEYPTLSSYAYLETTRNGVKILVPLRGCLARRL